MQGGEGCTESQDGQKWEVAGNVEQVLQGNVPNGLESGTLQENEVHKKDFRGTSP